MSPYIVPSQEVDYDILASEEYIESRKPYYPEGEEDAYVEYKSLINLTSRAILPFGSCLFHAAAFRWKGYAWLMTGPSGIGKTTQYRNWKRIFRDELEMISGDIPLLELMEDGGILVRPTPWNGKERIRGKRSSPLGGIVVLEQAEMDSMELMAPEESALPVFRQFAVRPDTEEQIRKLEFLENQLLGSCPIWKLMNRGDMGSVHLASKVFSEYLEREKR